MKHLTSLVFSLFLVGSAFSQLTYESPHVKDGKTIMFTLPTGYYEAANSVNYGNAMYSTDPTLDVEEMEFESLGYGVIGVSHETFHDGALEEFVAEMKAEAEEMTDATLVDAPHVEVLNGRKCLLAGISGIVENGTKMDAMYVSATAFGDYMVVIYYMVGEKNQDNLSYEAFKKIIGSAKEIATDREDEMMIYEDEIEEEYVTNYVNDLYETSITYYEILPDFGDDWNEPMDENTHLLGEFVYREDQGNVAIFSGGDASNYPSKAEMASAIQNVFDLSATPTIKEESSFTNEDHTFKVHGISGAGPIIGLYTTVVLDELMFFVVINGDPANPEFKAAARDFMMSMWVDSNPWTGGDAGIDE